MIRYCVHDRWHKCYRFIHADDVPAALRQIKEWYDDKYWQQGQPKASAYDSWIDLRSHTELPTHDPR